MPQRPIAVEDLTRLRWAMEPDVHPTDQLLAFVASGPDQETDQLSYDVHVSHTHGDGLFVERSSRKPRWSPNGKTLAFARHSGERWVSAARDLDGTAWELASPPGDVVDLRWGPSSDALLAIVAAPTTSPESTLPYRAISQTDWAPGIKTTAWLLETRSDPIPIAASLINVSGADWAPDGDTIVLVSHEGVDRGLSLADGLWLWSIGREEVHNLLAPTKPIHAVSWSPDGSHIAYLMGSRDNANSALNELWIHDLNTDKSRRLGADLDRSIGKPVRGDDERGVGAPILEWTQDSSGVFALYADGGYSRLASFALDGSHEDVDVDQPCVLEFSARQDAIAYSWSDPITPGEVSWLDREDRESQQVTRLNDGFLAEVKVAPTIRLSIVASDGVEIEGWLTLPTNIESPPLVLQVHGGPHYAVGERFSFDAQRLAAKGLAVLRSNPRGSQGYGQAFADGNLGDWGGRDLEDLVELVDHVVSAKELDEERIAVIGESYGGYLAAWAAGSTDMFAAAVVENGIADFLSSARGAIGPTFWHSELGGAPWESRDIYLDRSPITRLHRISIPILILHCEADETCEIQQGEAIFEGLRQLGADVEFWRVPKEGHFFNVFGAVERRMERTRILDEFLTSRLNPGNADQQSATKGKKS